MAVPHWKRRERRTTQPRLAPGEVSIDELAAMVGVQPRALRIWMKAGILPRGARRGRWLGYDEAVQLRARAAAVLARRTRRLEDVAKALAGLDDAGLRAIAGLPEPEAEPIGPAEASPREPSPELTALAPELAARLRSAAAAAAAPVHAPPPEPAPERAAAPVEPAAAAPVHAPPGHEGPPLAPAPERTAAPVEPAAAAPPPSHEGPPLEPTPERTAAPVEPAAAEPDAAPDAGDDPDWRRVPLLPGLELRVRRDAPPLVARIAEAIARGDWLP